jgi:hypothetical protein
MSLMRMSLPKYPEQNHPAWRLSELDKGARPVMQCRPSERNGRRLCWKATCRGMLQPGLVEPMDREVGGSDHAHPDIPPSVYGHGCASRNPPPEGRKTDSIFEPRLSWQTRLLSSFGRPTTPSAQSLTLDGTAVFSRCAAVSQAWFTEATGRSAGGEHFGVLVKSSEQAQVCHYGRAFHRSLG